jgi:L-alanine-DL-glutamate epimerase-like enolase superfamily enzyme
MRVTRCDAPIDRVDVSAYRIPTDGGPESDGTLEWTATTLVLVEVAAAGHVGLGYTYADEATALVVREHLRDVLEGRDALQTGARYADMQTRIRNLGRGGISSMALSAVDVALWDLKGRVLDAPVCVLLGSARVRLPVYGSGGFTSYSVERLCRQLSGWVEDGIERVKMKVGRDPAADPARVAASRRAIGESAQLFVDANGAYAVKEALGLARRFADERVTWFEEPVYHRDLADMRRVRDAAPPGMEVAAGEYGYAPDDFWAILNAGGVDCLQADATRCGGFSGLLAVDGLCQAVGMPLSTHCAPHLHLHAALACKSLRHAEYFYDHVRVERMLFDGAEAPIAGALAANIDRPGIGLDLRRADAARYAL